MVIHLDLHAEAKLQFNSKGQALLEHTAQPKNHQQSKEKLFVPDLHISDIVTSDDLRGDFEERTENQDGITIHRKVTRLGESLELSGEAYLNLRILAEDIQRNKIYRDNVSITFVEDVIFEWIKARHFQCVTQELVDYFEDYCQSAIQEREIWIPVTNLHIQSNFEVGRVVFKTFTREMLDQWVNRNHGKLLEELGEEKFQEYSKRERKNVQSFAAAVVKTNAEPIRAGEIAFELAEEAIGILRALSPYSLSAKRICYCAPLGYEKFQEYQYYYVLGGEISHSIKGLLSGDHSPWIIDNDQLIHIRNSGLDILSEVIKQKEQTDFQKVMLDTLMIYSKACLMKNISDKLVYILVALESLLLKSSNEPIQQNIAERIALKSGKDVEDKMRIKKLVIQIYGMRSNFIHHGNAIKNIEILEEFMFSVFIFLLMVISEINIWPTKEAFINKFEEMKFS
ncbi:MAG: hypothetical protein AB9917_11105 [Negativicutes bacterium]